MKGKRVSLENFWDDFIIILQVVMTTDEKPINGARLYRRNSFFFSSLSFLTLFEEIRDKTTWKKKNNNSTIVESLLMELSCASFSTHKTRERERKKKKTANGMTTGENSFQRHYRNDLRCASNIRAASGVASVI